MGRASVIRWIVMVGVLLACPLSGFAQEASITGTVKDSTGAVLPGVAIKAVNETTGNSFDAVTDGAGVYRLAVRVGSYSIVADLMGFTTLTRRGLNLLVGQRVEVNLEMAPATLQETVTVTGDAPLIDITNSTVSGNITPTQMQELPVQGRNWMDLAALAPGSRQSTIGSGEAGAGGGGTAAVPYQINMDGAQVTQTLAGGFGQANYSRDAIAEFEFISNRFDATQGRSAGIVVNAISRSGTNTFAGSFSGYFRSDKFNAADHVLNRVLRYSDQQLVGTFGGPIRKNRIHFFANFEYEREPQTYSYTSPYPSFNFDQYAIHGVKKGGGRVDIQFSSKIRMAVRLNKSTDIQPLDSRYAGGALYHPSENIATGRHSTNFTTTLSQIFNNSALNEIRFSYGGFWWDQLPPAMNYAHPYGFPYGAPVIQMQGYNIGQQHTNSPQTLKQDPYWIRDDYRFSFSAKGRHDVKAGGEYGYQKSDVSICDFCMGLIDARGGPVPKNIEALIPVWNDVSTWNIAALSPITRTYRIGVGAMHVYPNRHVFAGWLQDDWAASSRLTVNLGLRYDFYKGSDLQVAISPFNASGRPPEKLDFQPRLGLVYKLTEKTVLRGGLGKYYGAADDNQAFWTMLSGGEVQATVKNDGRPDFASNPFNGPYPTLDQAFADIAAGKYARYVRFIEPPGVQETQYSWQGSVGLQQQLGSVMMFEADYVNTRTENISGYGTARDVNLAYNPATGANYRSSDYSKRPIQGFEAVNMRLPEFKRRYHALQAGFTKRMNQRWQASASYLLAFQYELQPAPINPGCTQPMTMPSPGVFRCDLPITLNPAIAEEWYLDTGERNRLVLNGIWDIGYGFQASGLYFYGDNGWATPTSGVDALQTGTTAGPILRVRANGTLTPRNGLDLPSIHRLDVRLMKRFKLGSRASIDGLLEVFNALDHANYATLVNNERNAQYGKPTYNSNLAYAPRTMQLGFRATF